MTVLIFPQSHIMTKGMDFMCSLRFNRPVSMLRAELNTFYFEDSLIMC